MIPATQPLLSNIPPYYYSAPHAVGVIEGALYGAAAGSAAGFVGGAGNAWVRGASSSEIFRRGYQGVAWGAAFGAVSGGIGGGIRAKRMGLNTLTGTGTMESVSEVGGTYDVAEAQKLADIYDNGSNAITNDEILKGKVEPKYPTGRIQTLTTKTGDNYGLLSDGQYLRLETGNKVPAYTTRYMFGKVDLHVSPYVTNADAVVFKAYVGHEMIHIYHYGHFGKSYSKLYSEGMAYKYSYDVFMNAGRISDALGVQTSAIELGFWLDIKDIPYPYRPMPEYIRR